MRVIKTIHPEAGFDISHREIIKLPRPISVTYGIKTLKSLVSEQEL
jgi:hypothetical protein